MAASPAPMWPITFPSSSVRDCGPPGELRGVKVFVPPMVSPVASRMMPAPAAPFIKSSPARSVPTKSPSTTFCAEEIEMPATWLKAMTLPGPNSVSALIGTPLTVPLIVLPIAPPIVLSDVLTSIPVKLPRDGELSPRSDELAPR